MRTLSDKQREAVEKLARLKVGALFMECGTGKTQAATSLIDSVDGIDLLLWICPCRTKENLAAELALCKCRYAATIIGVESIGQSDRVFLETLSLVQTHKKIFLVMDESIKIKNLKAQRAKRLLQISQYCEYKLILNGTPVTKNILDVYAQMQFLSPKILGMSFAEFREKFCVYKKFMLGNVVQRIQVTGYANVDALLAIIKPFVYRCELELSCQKYYSVRKWHSTQDERDEYDALKNWLLAKYASSDSWDEVNILAILSRLQHSYCLAQDKLDIVKDLADEDTIIFCKYIRSRVELEKICPTSRVLTYGVGSFGLNLQRFNRIVFFDKTFDYAFREQAEARIYRTGQKRDCFYIDMTGDYGLETMIDRCIEKKLGLVDYFKAKGRQAAEEL